MARYSPNRGTVRNGTVFYLRTVSFEFRKQIKEPKQHLSLSASDNADTMPVGDVHGGGGGRLSERCGSRNELSSYNSMSLRRDGRSKKCNTTSQKVATILRSRSCRDREILCEFSLGLINCIQFDKRVFYLYKLVRTSLWKNF